MKNKFNELTYKELVKKREELIKEHRELRFNLVVGHVDNPLKKRIIKRQIARINTIIHEFDLGLRKEKEKVN